MSSHPVLSRLSPTLAKSSALKRSLPFDLVLAIVALVLWQLLRLALWVDVGQQDQLAWKGSFNALGMGGWFDIWTLAYLLAPLFLLSSVLPNRLRLGRWANRMRWFMLLIAIAALIFGVVAEFIFWQEFTTRFNFIAVDYLIYTHEVIGNIRESYPIPLMLGGIGLVSTVLWLLVRKWVSFRVVAHTLRGRTLMMTLGLGLPIAATLFANLDQSSSTNHYAEELAGNGLFSLAAAMRRNELDYDKFYATMKPNDAQQVLAKLGVTSGRQVPGSMPVHLASLNGASPIESHATQTALPSSFARRPKNIVLITVESLSAEYLGSYGGNQQLTPQLDKIASEGLRFSHLYATGTRTVRGLEALSLGTPPIPGQAIIHRPNNEHLATLGELLQDQGFASYFIYGGYGYFDNMNHYFRGNDYRVVDRTDFDPKSIATENIWGVADESLFDNTLHELDRASAEGRPFMAQIMTTSNHRPYTFPEHRVQAEQGTRKGAIEYTDYAIGRFITQAKAKPWFKDTLFVIVADHCASVAGKTSLPVGKYQIPLIFYAPDMLQPGEYSRMASQIDIAPTLMQILGQPQDTFYGESLFAEHLAEPRAFISNYQDLGYYKHDHLIVLSPKGKVQAFKIDPASYEATPAPVDSQLLKEAIAYYQTASNAFKHGELKFHHPHRVLAAGEPHGRG
ncbi:sulfatase-like hydrolase/transferase [Methylobacillus gramineus]|uniref:LTA synthase family protein n=1 Tax=Methylobacillus gramineus TaxID=755169 RepID=UPI001CFF6B14|nr:alkaline phosphatase family protein [Methylobacillus gramineus]MCB5184958.1 sulfatase-like hydrolase/transferase [Methylobacillus gramineus]